MLDRQYIRIRLDINNGKILKNRAKTILELDNISNIE